MKKIIVITTLILTLALTACTAGNAATRQSGENDPIAAELAVLQAEVQELKDERDIRDLYTGFSQGVDADDPAILSEIFTEDIVGDYSEDFGFVLKGLENFIAQTQGSLGPPITQHVMATYDIDIDGDTATGFRYVIAWHVDPDDPTHQFKVGARYLDTLVRTPTGWKISEFTFKILWADGDPAVVGGES